MENMARLIDITNCTSIIYALIRKAISTFPLLLLVQPPDNHRYRLSSTSQAPLLQEHEVTRNFLCHHWQEYFGSLLIYNRTRGNNVQRNPLEIRQWYIYTPWLPNVFLRQKQFKVNKMVLVQRQCMVGSSLSYFTLSYQI